MPHIACQQITWIKVGWRTASTSSWWSWESSEQCDA